METYYHPKDLAKFAEIGEEASALAQKFFEYYHAVFAEGELTQREKSLIALAVSNVLTVLMPILRTAWRRDQTAAR
jgi:alkylhydroperoxidase/carboxymuconolactone decarboxylase family protein YurZ